MSEQYLINHPRLSVHVRTGSEGPRHDPYSYEEITVCTPQGKIILHEGLAEWVKVNGARSTDRPRDVYEEWVGFTVKQLWRIARKRLSRCRHCGGRDFATECGFPGESFSVCMTCHHINAATFNRSEVE